LGQLIIGKVIKIISTRCRILRLHQIRFLLVCLMEFDTISPTVIKFVWVFRQKYTSEIFSVCHTVCT